MPNQPNRISTLEKSTILKSLSSLKKPASDVLSKTSLTLLDEILVNQSKILAPAKYLKINKDGSLGETLDLKKYLEKKKNYDVIFFVKNFLIFF